MERPTRKKGFTLRSLLPSSLTSLVIHVVVLGFVATSLRGCGKGQQGEASGEGFREIGLTFVDADSSTDSNQVSENTDSTDIQQPEPVQETQPRPVPQEVPNVADFLNPTTAPPTSHPTPDLTQTIGPGRSMTGTPESGGALADLIRPQGTSGGSAGSTTPGVGETTFMNIVGSGRSFVYVIDTSSSMKADGRLDLAKNQLKGSLRILRPNQKFQVLFYNSTVQSINLRRRPRQEMYTATTVHLELAVDAIDMETANFGTAHLPAIERALLLQPDVIYFLTDGDRPGVNDAELRRLRRQNTAKSQIHVIEFASNTRESRQQSWLEKLAAQSSGQYRRILVK